MKTVDFNSYEKWKETKSYNLKGKYKTLNIKT